MDTDYDYRTRRETVNGITTLELVLHSGEVYRFIFDEDNRAEAIRQMSRFASNPAFSFSWFDAARLSQEIRILCEVPQLVRNRIATLA